MEEVDDWFYDSIKRYDKLQMFTLNENVHHIEFAPNKTNICVSNENLSTKLYQILEYELPIKFLDVSDTLCSSDHNLKIVSGTYVDHLVLELKVLASSNKIISSEKHQSNVHVYSLPEDGSDRITLASLIPSDYPEPRISTHPQSEHLLGLSHSATHPISVLDITSNTPLHKLHVDCAMESLLRTEFIDPHVLCVCVENFGEVRLYDLRCSNEVVSSNVKDKPKQSEHWTMSLSSESSPSISLLSSHARVSTWDPRDLTQPTFRTQLELPLHTRHSRHLLESCPHDPRLFSVSGFDENVHIYEKSEQALCNEVFTHDAHPYQELCDRNTRVLCHRWMPRPYERMLLSSADNASVTCVQYSEC